MYMHECSDWDCNHGLFAEFRRHQITQMHLFAHFYLTVGPWLPTALLVLTRDTSSHLSSEWERARFLSMWPEYHWDREILEAHFIIIKQVQNYYELNYGYNRENKKTKWLWTCPWWTMKKRFNERFYAFKSIAVSTFTTHFYGFLIAL